MFWIIRSRFYLEPRQGWEWGKENAPRMSSRYQEMRRKLFYLAVCLADLREVEEKYGEQGSALKLALRSHKCHLTYNINLVNVVFN